MPKMFYRATEFSYSLCAWGTRISSGVNVRKIFRRSAVERKPQWVGGAYICPQALLDK